MGVRAVSLGCRLNGAEAETMRRLAEAAGQRDLTIVNTCAVTAEATRQSAQAIRRAGRLRPQDRIVATGCAAEIDPGRFRAIPELAGIVPNGAKTDPETWIRLGGATATSELRYGLAGPASDGGAGRVRAFVEAQNGCDHDCTFCTIPRGRGRSRSQTPEAVIAAVRDAVEGGAREVVLTGVDLTAYGADLAGTPALGRLVRLILRAVPDLPRLRLSSIDSAEAESELLAAFAEEPRLMPHLHLSLQAGDDMILTRMKRRHRRADAVAVCRRLRAVRPDIVFGADLIAGFPTESEAMFGRTLDLAQECGLTYLHVFPYSVRPGTPAARMPAVPGEIVRERAGRLRGAGEAALRRHLAAEVGRTRQVLFEDSGLGRTEGFAPVRAVGPVEPRALRSMRITGQDGSALLAA